MPQSEEESSLRTMIEHRACSVAVKCSTTETSSLHHLTAWLAIYPGLRPNCLIHLHIIMTHVDQINRKKTYGACVHRTAVQATFPSARELRRENELCAQLFLDCLCSVCIKKIISFRWFVCSRVLREITQDKYGLGCVLKSVWSKFPCPESGSTCVTSSRQSLKSGKWRNMYDAERKSPTIKVAVVLTMCWSQLGKISNA